MISRYVGDLPVAMSLIASLVTASLAIQLIKSIMATNEKRVFMLSGLTVATLIIWVPLTVLAKDSFYKAGLGFFIYILSIILIGAGAVLEYRRVHP